jgi:hypothetical protein
MYIESERYYTNSLRYIWESTVLVLFQRGSMWLNTGTYRQLSVSLNSELSKQNLSNYVTDSRT